MSRYKWDDLHTVYFMLSVLFKEREDSDAESPLLSGHGGHGGKSSPTISSMVRPGKRDQFGMLNFRCEYVKEHGELLVTVVWVLLDISVSFIYHLVQY